MAASLISREWLHSFLPAQTSVDLHERLRGCVGALIGIVLTGLITYLCIGDAGTTAWLVAPMGASAVLLFGVPNSPLAQPWSIVGGNFVAALIGVACTKFLYASAPAVAAGLAVSLAIGAMFILRCIHPPSGAVALTMVMGGPVVHAAGYGFVFKPIMINTFILASLAVLYNNMVGRRYPHSPLLTPPVPAPTAGEPPVRTTLGFSAEELDEVLRNYNQVLDVSREDLEEIFIKVEALAYRRRFGEMVCGDIMRTDMVTAEFGTRLDEAWRLLHTHKLKALPVLNQNRRVIGIVTPIDFMEHAGVETFVGFKGRFRHLLNLKGTDHDDKPEFVGQIMTTKVYTARELSAVVDLVPLIAEHGLRHIPVVDEEDHLVGVLTQADMVNALYGHKLIGA